MENMNGEKQEDFKFYVIGAGLPRTGTLSLKAALEKILPGKCMHFTNVFNSNLTEVLANVLEDSSTEKSFKDYFITHNIVAGVDIPFIYHYERAMKIFPNAKVILTVREPSTWVTSMEQTVYAAWKTQVFKKFPFTLFSYFSPLAKRFLEYTGNHFVIRNALQCISNGKGVEHFNEWVEDVKNTVPPKRLLIFSVKEGWEPLCKFLDLPIPDEPFPHENDTKHFQESMKIHKAKVWLLLIGLVTLPIIFAFAGAKYLM